MSSDETSGLILDVKRFAVHDGPGIRTTLFLKGCPLRCRWCHNPESIAAAPQLAYYDHKCIGCGECLQACSQGAHTVKDGVHHLDRSACSSCGACEDNCLGDALKLYGRPMSVKEAVRVVEEDLAFYGDDGGVTLSGGEPLLQVAFCTEFLHRMKRIGIGTAIDTCGFAPWRSFEAIRPLTDIFLFDLKHINTIKHQELTGRPNDLILANLERLAQSGARIEVRIPLVPGMNDSQENLRETHELLRRLSIDAVKILPYHDLSRAKYAALGLTDTLPHPRQIALRWKTKSR